MHETTQSQGPSLHIEALPLIKDLLEPNPVIYWVDFLFCTILGWSAFAMTVASPALSWTQAFWFTVATFGMYRSVIFIHEIAHFKKGAVPGFTNAWNLLIGIPMLLPSFSYEGVHLDHHRRNIYGTKQDGEYLPFAQTGRLSMLVYLLSSLFIPAILITRCLILTPINFLIPSVRAWTWKHLSSLAIDFTYERDPASPEEARRANIQELLTLATGLTYLGLILSGILPIQAFYVYYAVGSSINFVNSLRTLAAHRYINSENTQMKIDEQFLDSVDITGNRLVTGLWAPVGLRYHATHHLFPAIPYHNLAKTRARLEKVLSYNKAVYQKSLRPSLYSALVDLWKSTKRPELALTSAS